MALSFRFCFRQRSPLTRALPTVAYPVLKCSPKPGFLTNGREESRLMSTADLQGATEAGLPRDLGHSILNRAVRSLSRMPDAVPRG